MLKNRKTGQPVPLYMVKVLMTKIFEEIYKIKEISHISATIETFLRYERVKKCYRFQDFGHASEILHPKARSVGQNT